MSIQEFLKWSKHLFSISGTSTSASEASGTENGRKRHTSLSSESSRLEGRQLSTHTMWQELWQGKDWGEYQGEGLKQAWSVNGSFAEETSYKLSAGQELSSWSNEGNPHHLQANWEITSEHWRSLEEYRRSVSEYKDFLSQKSHRGRTQDGSAAMGLHKAGRPLRQKPQT